MVGWISVLAVVPTVNVVFGYIFRVLWTHLQV